MKRLILCIIAFSFYSLYAYAEEAPKVYSDKHLKKYRSSTDETPSTSEYNQRQSPISQTSAPQTSESSQNQIISVGGSSSCKVESYSEYTDFVSSGGGIVQPGDSVHVEVNPIYCVSVDARNLTGGSRFGGKITATFSNGEQKTKTFSTGKGIGSGVKSYKYIDNGQIYTANVCWGKKRKIVKVECEYQ